MYRAVQGPAAQHRAAQSLRHPDRAKVRSPELSRDRERKNPAQHRVAAHLAAAHLAAAHLAAQHLTAAPLHRAAAQRVHLKAMRRQEKLHRQLQHLWDLSSLYRK